MSDIVEGCGEIKTKLVDYVDDGLSHEERLAVEVHIARCYACRENVEELARLLELCGAALQHPNPCGRFEDLKQRLESEEPQYKPVVPGRRLRQRRTWHRLAVAAVIIIVLAAAPFLVKGAMRLMAPVEDSAALAGNGTNVGRLRRLLEKTPFFRRERSVEKATQDGKDSSVPDDGSNALESP